MSKLTEEEINLFPNLIRKLKLTNNQKRILLELTIKFNNINIKFDTQKSDKIISERNNCTMSFNYQDIKYCSYCGSKLISKIKILEKINIYTRICPRCMKYKDPIV